MTVGYQRSQSDKIDQTGAGRNQSQVRQMLKLETDADFRN